MTTYKLTVLAEYIMVIVIAMKYVSPICSTNEYNQNAKIYYAIIMQKMCAIKKLSDNKYQGIAVISC